MSEEEKDNSNPDRPVLRFGADFYWCVGIGGLTSVITAYFLGLHIKLVPAMRDFMALVVVVDVGGAFIYTRFVGKKVFGKTVKLDIFSWQFKFICFYPIFFLLGHIIGYGILCLIKTL